LSFRGWTNGFRPRTKNKVVVFGFDTEQGWIATGNSPSSRNGGAATVDAPASRDLLDDRVRSVVEVARRFETSVELETLVELLPEYGPTTAGELAGWVRARPQNGRVSGTRVVPKDAPDLPPDGGRRERAEEYFQAANRLYASELNAARRWLRFLAVTGSAAYGDPREGDDCDLMAIVRPGSLWVFVAYVFLRLRFRANGSGRGAEPRWCFNYTLDEEAAIREFSRPRGFLFAREALVARPVEGESYYRGLLRRGGWLRQEAPRLYARWEATPLPEPVEPEPAPGGVRWLNALLFPAVAAYLQLKGLRANHRLRRTGRDEERFRTITRLGQMGLATSKYEQLSDRMVPANRLPPE
jgi:hypothetical protein